ncbi:MAG: GAF domain-containing protein [Chloroflexi bacterium]|nr:GAF domain-containing protein [Chloroflexota bacterium]
MSQYSNNQFPRRTDESGFLAKLKVGRKLNLLSLVMAVGITAVFITAAAGMRNMRFHLSNMYDYMLIPVAGINRANIALADIETQFETLRTQDLTDAEKQDLLRTIKTFEASFSFSIDQYETEWATTLRPEFTEYLEERGLLDLQKSETEALNELHRTFNIYLDARNEFEKMILSGAYDEELAKTSLNALGETRLQLRHLIDINDKFGEFSNDSAQTAYRRALNTMIAALAIVGMLGITLAVSISRSIVARLGIVIQAARDLHEGYMDRRMTITVGGQDEITSLADTFNAMASQIRDLIRDLETRVQERTAQLDALSKQSRKRAGQFEGVTQVSRAIGSTKNLQELLPQIARVISQQFGFYHVGIFLLDAANEYAVLRAANSKGGATLIENGHKLRVGQVGIVGVVAGSGNPRIALDTGEDAAFFDNPELPFTRSEMALPLFLSGRQVIGVLDVQSTEPGAFGQEDIEILSTLADQVSIAIANARLFEETQRALNEADLIYRHDLRAGWSRFARTQKVAGIRRSGSQASILKEALNLPGMDEVSQSGEIYTKADRKDGNVQMTLPVKLRGEVVGMLNIRTDAKREWGQDELDIVAAIVERAALSIENARLLSESQKLADKERAIGEIAAKVSSYTSRENILQAAVTEIGKMMPGAEVVIQFKPKDEPN